MRRAPSPSRLLRFVALATAVFVSACGGGHLLADYSFADHSLAMVDYGTPAPVLLTGGGGGPDLDDPLGSLVEAGSRVAEEIEGRKARARLDSATARVDVGARMGDRILARGSRYLGADPVSDADRADYLLELDVRNFGIDARGRDAAYLFVVADAYLLEADRGVEIWSTEVRGHDRLTPSVAGKDPIPGDAVTAGVLSSLSVEDFRRVLERLADFSSDAVTDQLRSDLREMRRERRGG